MDGSLSGGVGNTAPELLQGIQELDRRLASIEADNRKERSWSRPTIELGKQQEVELASRSSEASPEFGACSNALKSGGPQARVC